ncbi:MAG: serine/threonine-protein kinase [Myxococcales bacterium]|nr:serine/threonine-protein kinase [Myxococcales bacterium]
MSKRGSQRRDSLASGDSPVEATGPTESGMRPAARGDVPEVGSIVGHKYRIDAVLGHGGMGTVFSATHRVSGKQVALKWMRPPTQNKQGATARFIREARATARIDHPNVIDIYDVGLQNGAAYLVMELLRGESLAARLERGTFSDAEAMATLMPCLRGVAAAHEKGVVHRDLKPDNIMLCTGPKGQPREPKVLDFGISKIGTGDDPQDMRLTGTGMVMGTPHYMSPEQVRLTREVDERGDIYAFGVILYEMLTGAHPFDGHTYNELIVNISTGSPTPLGNFNPSVDPRLVEVVMRAMARDPADRFSSIAAMGAALEQITPDVRFDSVPAPGSGSNPSLVSSAHSASRMPGSPHRSAMNFLQRKHRSVILLAGLASLAMAVALWGIRPPQGQLDGDAPPSAKAGPSRSGSEQVSGRDAPSVPAKVPVDDPPLAEPRSTTEGLTDTLPEGILIPEPPAKAPQTAARVADRERRQQEIRRRKLRRGRKKAEANGRATQERASEQTKETTTALEEPKAAPRRLSERWDEELEIEAPPVLAPATPRENSAGELSLDDI